ncbi:MAG TPA: ester cyclase [Bacteroidia bacterium]|jgi:predicted ester cyclase|nr:ester cyclase [Bacteroidia bacterium]
MENSKLIAEFIDQIWNKRNFEKMDEFLHPEFRDASLPDALTPDKEGMKKWILATGASFEHKTTVEEHVTEKDKCMIRIRMHLKHIGAWRNIEPTGLEVNANGFRFYRIADGKILEHWGLIDGQAIENELKQASHGCKI